MTARGDSSPPFSTEASTGRAATAPAAVTTALILTLALQSAVPPFATDMYTPAFPQVTADLATTASLVGLTLTTFFLGMAAGQLLGGPLSDQRGRRMPMIVGGLICTLGAVGCALAPSIWILIGFRIVQGFGGGLAAVVARAVVVDVAKGDQLARVMSILMALGGLAPMIAAADDDHRHLPRPGVAARRAAPRRRAAPIRVRTARGAASPPVRRLHADRSVVRLHDDGVHRKLLLRPAGDEGRCSVAFRPVLATVAVAALTVGVVLLGTPLVLTCAGFLVLMAVQAFIFGNANALAAAQVPHVAGAASAVLGVTQAVALATSAPIASSGGATTAVPMIFVMIVGIAGSLFSYLVLARRRSNPAAGPRSTVLSKSS